MSHVLVGHHSGLFSSSRRPLSLPNCWESKLTGPSYKQSRSLNAILPLCGLSELSESMLYALNDCGHWEKKTWE